MADGVYFPAYDIDPVFGKDLFYLRDLEKMRPVDEPGFPPVKSSSVSPINVYFFSLLASFTKYFPRGMSSNGTTRYSLLRNSSVLRHLGISMGIMWLIPQHLSSQTSNGIDPAGMLSLTLFLFGFPQFLYRHLLI